MTQWQPIETAPKDGTDILVFCSTINQKEMAVVWFDPFAGWINFREDSYAPCSWMPLPPPPQSPSSTPATDKRERYWYKDNKAIEALEWVIGMKDDDSEKFEKLPEYFQVNIGRLVFYAREFIEENMTYPDTNEGEKS